MISFDKVDLFLYYLTGHFVRLRKQAHRIHRIINEKIPSIPCFCFLLEDSLFANTKIFICD